MSTPTDFHLIYFPIRGKLESIRLQLEDAGIPYEDTRMTDWAKQKSKFIEEGKTPFGQLPLVECKIGSETHYLVQSLAIHKFIDNFTGGKAASPIDDYNIDMIAQGTEDWRKAYGKLVYSNTFEQDKPGFIQENSKKWADIWEELLKKNSANNTGSTVVFVGTKPTSTDYLQFEAIDLMIRIDPNFLQSSPNLTKFYQYIKSRPNIAKYLESGRRPERVNGSGNG